MKKRYYLGLGSCYILVMVLISSMTIFQSCEGKDIPESEHQVERYEFVKVAAQAYWTTYIKPLKFPGDEENFVTHELITVDLIAAALMEQYLFSIPAEITIAQYILESKSNGKYSYTQLAKTNNNYFGVKAIGGQDYISHNTREVISGRDTIMNEKFAVYASKWWSIRAHSKKLFKWYSPKDKSIEGWLNSLQGKYATDPRYAEILKRVMKQYNLNFNVKDN